MYIQKRHFFLSLGALRKRGREIHYDRIRLILRLNALFYADDYHAECCQNVANVDVAKKDVAAIM